MSHGTAPLQQSVLAYLRTIPAGEWVTLEDVIFAVKDQPTRAGKSSVRRTAGILADAGLVEHETGSHEIRLVPSARPLTCEVCGAPIQATNKTRLCRKTVECRRERDRRRADTKPGVPKTLHNYRRKMLYSARFRAKKYGIPFDITMDDIPEIPERCPLLGIPLVMWQSREEHRENTPSLDKIDPSLGYVRGNLWIISTRANQIKNDATPGELMKVALGVRDELARRRTARPLGTRKPRQEERLPQARAAKEDHD
jgi:hypothetical protein